MLAPLVPSELNKDEWSGEIKGASFYWWRTDGGVDWVWSVAYFWENSNALEWFNVVA